MTFVSGPGSQRVLRRFSLGFSEYMAASVGYCVYSTDARGTGYNNRYGNGFMYVSISTELILLLIDLNCERPLLHQLIIICDS